MVKFELDASGYEILRYTAMDSDDGLLIKDILRKKLNISTSLLKKVKFGGVSINGTAVTMRKYVISGDLIEVRLPKEESEGIEPIDLPLNIAYEDEHILAVIKPTNMPTHPSRGNNLVTLANLVMAYMGEGFVFRSINRLDRDTSGIVIIAKNQYVAGILASDMKAGLFEKYYEAILSSAPKELYGIIDAPIERESEGNIKRCVRADGKRAITEYKVTKLLEDGRAVCEIRLHTGRTHQIRVHMAYIGAPLYADYLYGNEIPDESYSLIAKKIIIPHPITRERLELKC